MINNVDASAYIQPLSSEVIVQNTRENFLYCNMYGDLFLKKKKKLKSVRTRPEPLWQLETLRQSPRYFLGWLQSLRLLCVYLVFMQAAPPGTLSVHQKGTSKTKNQRSEWGRAQIHISVTAAGLWF